MRKGDWQLMELKNNYYIMPTYISRQGYTHFNDQGAKVIAKMFSQALLKAYNKHH